MLSLKIFCVYFGSILIFALRVSAKEDTIRFFIQRISSQENIKVEQCEASQPRYNLVSHQRANVELYGEADMLVGLWCVLESKSDKTVYSPFKPMVNVTDKIYKTEMEILNAGNKHADLTCYKRFSSEVVVGPIYVHCVTHIEIIDSNERDEPGVDFNYTSTFISVQLKADKNNAVRDVEYYDNSSIRVSCGKADVVSYSGRYLHLLLKDTTHNIVKQLHEKSTAASQADLNNLDYSYNNMLISCSEQEIYSNKTIGDATVRLKYRIKLVKDTPYGLTFSAVILLVICVLLAFMLVTLLLFYTWRRFRGKRFKRATKSDHAEDIKYYSVQYRKNTDSMGLYSSPVNDSFIEYAEIYGDRPETGLEMNCYENYSHMNRTTSRPPLPPVETIPTKLFTSR